MNEQLNDNWTCVSDDWNLDLNYLPFGYDQMVIAWWSIDYINDYSIERLNCSLIVEVYSKPM